MATSNASATKPRNRHRYSIPTISMISLLLSLGGAMENVLGFGEPCFRSRDPQAFAAWYATYLGVTPVRFNYGDPGRRQQAGPTAFAPFPADTRYFGDPESPQPLHWMVDFRVANLDTMLAQLRAAGIEVTLDSAIYPNGRFACLHDPEGNPIEPWQPAGRDA